MTDDSIANASGTPDSRRILTWVARRRLMALVYPRSSALSTLMRLVVVVIVAGNGVLYGAAAAFLMVEASVAVPPRLGGAVLAGACFLLPWLYIFVPSYRPRPSIIGPLFPVPVTLRVVANILTVVMAPFYLHVGAFTVASVTAFCVTATSGSMISGGAISTMLAALVVLLVLFCSGALTWAVRTQMECVVSSPTYVAAVSGGATLALAAGIAALGMGLPYAVVAACAVGGTALTVAAVAVAANRVVHSVQQVQSTAPMRAPRLAVAALSVRSSAGRLACLSFPAVKLLILGFGYFMADASPNGFLFLLALSPLLPFTFFWNNVTGHFSTLWLQHEIAARSRVQVMGTALLLLAIPLSIDAAISILVAWYTGILSGSLAALYVGLLAVFIPTGLLASILSPRLVQDAFSWSSSGMMRNSTSTVASGITVILASVAVLAVQMDLVGVVVPLLLLLGGGLLTTLRYVYRDRKYDLFQTLTARAE